MEELHLENALLELYHTGCRVTSEFYLRDVDLKLMAGECVAIMGKNASGKSTLFSMLMGLHQADSGEILMDGQRVKLSSPQNAMSRGILLLGQNAPMFENMKVYENIYFGQELTKGKILDNKRMLQEATALLARLNIPVNPTAQMRELSHARRQLVSLARAVCSGTRLVLMDEPSTHLDAADKRMLWGAVNAMKADKKSVLYITHDPAEALAVADRVAFMEDGLLSGALPVSDFDEEALTARAYRIQPGAFYVRDRAEPGAEALTVDLPDIRFSLRQGEVAALLGDSHLAQSLLARMAGLGSINGEVAVNGRRIEPTPLSGIENGVSLALDDEAEAELATARELLDNGGKNTAGTRFTLGMQRIAAGLGGAFGGWLGMGRNREYVTGGNRRRELMERALARRAAVYLLMDPSAGMDVPSRMRMYERFGKIALEGGAILFATGNLKEAVGLADRLLVLKNGKLACDVPAGGDLSQVRAMLE